MIKKFIIISLNNALVTKNNITANLFKYINIKLSIYIPKHIHLKYITLLHLINFIRLSNNCDIKFIANININTNILDLFTPFIITIDDIK